MRAAILPSVRWPVRRNRKSTHPYREHSITDALAALPDEPHPTFTATQPAPDRETRPIPELREQPRQVLPASERPAPVMVATKDPEDLRRAAGALRQVDFDAVDEAKKVEGATHVSVRQARGRAPFYDQILKERGTPLGDPRRPAWRLPVEPNRIRHAETALRRTEELAYPPCDVTAPDHAVAYIALMRQLDRITGTQGRNWWTLPALPAGGAL
jgi:hypothetical protein